MHGTAAKNVVDLKPLHKRTVRERSMRRGETAIRAPYSACARCIKRAEGFNENAAPFELHRVKPAAERVENQQLDA